MTPNRIVAVLTPLVFAPLAGAVAAWAAENAPGVDLSQERLTNIFIAGALIALAPALQWLHGWQKHEQREAESAQAIELAGSAGAAEALAETEDDWPEEEDEALDELEALEDAEAFEGADELEDPLLDGEEEPVRAET